MDIVSHTLTGIAVGTVASTFSKQSWKTRAAIILSGGFGGAIPDFDAISLWSGFDSTIGALFNLTHTGNEIYFGKLWYSHHASLHSLLAPIFLCALFTAFVSIRNKNWHWISIKTYIIRYKLSYAAFCLGFSFHLLEDMPTPASVWGGVNLFFPASGYVGGFGKIWWWNNYDLFLIIVAVIFLNIGVNLIPKTYYKYRTKAAIGIFFLGMTLGIFQIMTRPIDFSYAGHTKRYDQLEKQSKEIQRDILGAKLYSIMESIDNLIPLYF